MHDQHAVDHLDAPLRRKDGHGAHIGAVCEPSAFFFVQQSDAITEHLIEIRRIGAFISQGIGGMGKG